MVAPPARARLGRSRQRFESIRFLVRDRGSNFTVSFDAVFQANGTRHARPVLLPGTSAIHGRYGDTCDHTFDGKLDGGLDGTFGRVGVVT